MSPRKVPSRLGQKLMTIRLHLGYTLEDMGDAVGRNDTSRRARVYEWEKGLRQPDLSSLLRYAELVNISTDDLIDDDVNINLEQE